MVDADTQFGLRYNAANFTGVQDFYNPGAELIPPTADTFLLGNTLASFFEASYKAGLRDVSMTPKHVLQESDSLWHELGEVKDSTGSGMYYVRWINPTGSQWQIAFDCMSVGAQDAARRRDAVEVDTPTPQWMNESVHHITDALNKHNYTGAASFYNPGAQFVPGSADAFLLQPQLADFFAAQHWGHIEVRVVLAYQEADTLWHCIGESKVDGQKPTRWYIRWVRPADVWQIAFELAYI